MFVRFAETRQSCGFKCDCNHYLNFRSNEGLVMEEIIYGKFHVRYYHQLQELYIFEMNPLYHRLSKQKLKKFTPEMAREWFERIKICQTFE